MLDGQHGRSVTTQIAPASPSAQSDWALMNTCGSETPNLIGR